MANPQVEKGHTDIANDIADNLAQTQLSGYESRVIWVIFRKTYGWHKKEENLTLEKISELTNIGNISHISRTVSRLVGRKIITKNGKFFSFQKDYDLWEKLPKMVTTLTKNGNKKLPKMVNSEPVYIKEKEKKLIKRKTITNVIVATPQYGNPEINELLKYADNQKFILQGTQKGNRFSASNMIKKFGLDDSKKFVDLAIKCRGKQFFPVISDFTALYRKAGDLAIRCQQEINDKPQVRDYDK